MSKHFSTIVVCVIAIMQSMLSAQTPYDSFHPETSRPMLRLERDTAWRQQIEDDNGSFLIVANHNSGIVMLYDLCGDSLVAVADINPDMLLWLSVDPLADKFIGTQPYLYCNGNPIRYIDPDGREITITGEDGITVTYIPGGKYEGNDSFTNETYTKLNQLNDMFSNTDFMPSIVNSSNIYNISSDESMVGGTHSFKNGVINIGTTCSIDGLGHELFHAYQDTKRQGGASIHNEVEAYLFQTKILFTLYQGSGSTPLTAAEKQSSSTYSNALNTLLFDGFNQNAFNAVVSEFKTASNANNLKVYDNYPLIRSNQMQSLIKHFYPIYP